MNAGLSCLPQDKAATGMGWPCVTVRNPCRKAWPWPPFSPRALNEHAWLWSFLEACEWVWRRSQHQRHKERQFHSHHFAANRATGCPEGHHIVSSPEPRPTQTLTDFPVGLTLLAQQPFFGLLVSWALCVWGGVSTFSLLSPASDHHSPSASFHPGPSSLCFLFVSH